MNISKTLSNLSRWPLFLTYTVLLFVAYTISLDQIPAAVLRVNDKLMHFLDFLLLALLSFRTFRASHSLFSRQAETKAVAFSLLYGAFLEWAQKNTVGRSPSVADWVADALGVFLAGFIFATSKLLP